ncbi:MAG: hypothetical protein KDA33_14650, partial [Phycisphaerales bacterium]|nr:hypothetical protein [Phycisphaerales bacterium]
YRFIPKAPLISIKDTVWLRPDFPLVYPNNLSRRRFAIHDFNGFSASGIRTLHGQERFPVIHHNQLSLHHLGIRRDQSRILE